MQQAKPLKVLLLAGRFEVRGSSARTLHLAEHLPPRGVQPQLVCIDACRVAPERRENYQLVSQPMLDVPVLDRVYRYFLYRDHADDPPDLIHIQWRGMLPLGQWLATVAYLFLAWLTEGARLFAAAPYAAVLLPAFPLWVLLAYYAIVVGGWLTNSLNVATTSAHGLFQISRER